MMEQEEVTKRVNDLVRHCLVDKLVCVCVCAAAICVEIVM